MLGGRRLGESVLVPVADDNLGPRGTLSALVARADKGVVVPVALVPETGGAAAHATARERLDRIESIVGRLGVETVGLDTRDRLDRTASCAPPSRTTRAA